MSANRRRRVVAFCLASIVLCSGWVEAQHKFGHRQFYGGWNRHPTHGYHYRPYYYKPTPTFNGFKHHYVIHHPSHPNHLYFFNPYTKKYWGRCPAQRDGVGRYSLLPEAARKGSLKEIKESDFPEPGDVPPIPESSDGEPLDLPPDDLPNEADYQPGKE
jgi:hypothetical protein